MNTHLTPHSTRFFALFYILLLALAGCAKPPTAAAPTQSPTSASAAGPYWPTLGWRTSTPEQQGMDSQKLVQMQAAIREKRLALHSLLIIRNGYLVSETYYGS